MTKFDNIGRGQNVTWVEKGGSKIRSIFSNVQRLTFTDSAGIDGVTYEHMLCICGI